MNQSTIFLIGIIFIGCNSQNYKVASSAKPLTASNLDSTQSKTVISNNTNTSSPSANSVSSKSSTGTITPNSSVKKEEVSIAAPTCKQAAIDAPILWIGTGSQIDQWPVDLRDVIVAYYGYPAPKVPTAMNLKATSIGDSLDNIKKVIDHPDNDGILFENETGNHYWWSHLNDALSKQEQLYNYAKSKNKIVVSTFQAAMVSRPVMDARVWKAYNKITDASVIYWYKGISESFFTGLIQKAKGLGYTKPLHAMADGGFRPGNGYLTVDQTVALGNQLCRKNTYLGAFRGDRLVNQESGVHKGVKWKIPFFGYDNGYFNFIRNTGRNSCGTNYPEHKICR